MKLDEVPAIPPLPLHRHAGEVGRRPLFLVSVAPRSGRRSINLSTDEGSLHSVPGVHDCESTRRRSLDQRPGLAAYPAREILEAGAIEAAHDPRAVDRDDGRHLTVEVFPLLTGVAIGIDSSHAVGDPSSFQVVAHRFRVGLTLAAVENYVHGHIVCLSDQRLSTYRIFRYDAGRLRRARGGPLYDRRVDLASEAARLRAEAEAKPLRLPVNRRIDERHRALTADGLSVWYTIQISPHSRIDDVLFERADRMPSDEECHDWLRELIPDRSAEESPALPGSHARRFDAFETNPSGQAPLA